MILILLFAQVDINYFDENTSLLYFIIIKFGIYIKNKSESLITDC